MASPAEAASEAPSEGPEEASTGGPSAHLPSLTAVRFFAAFVIVMRHLLGRFAHPSVADASALFLGTDEAVTLFFVLSGAIITLSWSSEERAAGFWRKRAARILPLYLLFGLLSAVWLVHQDQPVDLLDVVAYVTMTQAWTARVFALNNPAWSLSCEAFFYLVYPAVRPVLLLLATASSRAVAVIFLLVVKWQLVGYDHFRPSVRFVDFALGAVIGLHLRSRGGRRIPPLFGLALLAAAYAAVVVPSLRTTTSLTPSVFLGGAGFCILVLARADQRGEATGIRWAAPLGLRSYALFISHYLVIRVGVAAFSRAGWWEGTSSLEAWVQIGLLLAACFAVAELSFRFVERPSERRLRGAPDRVELVAAGA
ncbi:MAG: hypothetical protein JWO77_1968 [Ilumatobacteraceae bacterium]|nr:hypothetical protein [Ilumatobacteraceae bacterium]